jgi:hypothetical protein
MKRLSILVCAVAAALAAGNVASAQIIPPGATLLGPPPPPPLPPPKIEAPVVPKMDAPARQSTAPARRPSFSDRITNCLDQGAAGGLNPSDRSTYSRSCAN